MKNVKCIVPVLIPNDLVNEFRNKYEADGWSAEGPVASFLDDYPDLFPPTNRLYRLKQDFATESERDEAIEKLSRNLFTR